MTEIIYKKQRWTVLCPKILIWPNGVIRNLYIERKNMKLITNFKECKILPKKDITVFF